MNASRLWPAAIVGVLAVTVAANAALLYLVSDSRLAAVEPDYYRKAVAWDSVMAEQARSAALGWKIEASLGRGPRGDAVVSVRLLGADGAPLAGAAVEATAIHNLDPERPIPIALAPEAPGLYRGSAALRWSGLWELRIAAVRGGDRFVADLRRELAPVP